jgi:cyanophycinase-like exopeptidase
MSEQGCPTYLIAGGRGRERLRGPDPIAQEVIRRTGVRRPRVAYVGAASGDNAAFRLLIGGILKKAGAGEVILAPLCGRRGSADAAKEVLTGADLVFVSGGDVEEGMQVLQGKGMIPFLRRLHAGGTPFFGISAGSIMLARDWVRWTDPKNDGSAELFPCLGFAPVLCDTHGEGEGWGELKAALALKPTGAVGYGIVSGAALVVERDGAVCAAGGEVHVFKKRKAGVVQLESLLPPGGAS